MSFIFIYPKGDKYAFNSFITCKNQSKTEKDKIFKD